jgi:hypothetical protein
LLTSLNPASRFIAKHSVSVRDVSLRDIRVRDVRGRDVSVRDVRVRDVRVRDVRIRESGSEIGLPWKDIFWTCGCRVRFFLPLEIALP